MRSQSDGPANIPIVTGISALSSDYVAKSLQLLKETAPRATRIGVLGHASNPTFAIYRYQLEAAGTTLDLPLEFREMVSARTSMATWQHWPARTLVLYS